MYGWAKSEKLSVNGFEWVKDISTINKKLKQIINYIKNYNEDSDKRYILEVVVKYSKDLHSGLSFLPERMKTNKCSKLACNLHDKKWYVVHIRSLKQALH